MLPTRSRKIKVVSAIFLALGVFVTSFAIRNSASAADDPITSLFPRFVESNQPLVPQSTCSATAKPGTIKLRDWLNFFYGMHTTWITRSCSEGGTSEHKEGRALDFMTYGDTATGYAALNSLLATDSRGERHALARRFGIMYIVFDRKIYKAYENDWAPQAYYGSNPHTDHLHISLSWAGANAQTTGTSSWGYTKTASCSGHSVTYAYWVWQSGFGPLVQTRFVTDNGVTYDSATELTASPWQLKDTYATHNASVITSKLWAPKLIRPGTTCSLSLS